MSATSPSVPLLEIAERVGGSVEGASDVCVRGVAGLAEAAEGDLTFLANSKYASLLDTTKASAVLVAPGVNCPESLGIVRVSDPYAAIARILALFDPGVPDLPVGIHPSAVVADSAVLGDDVRVGPHAVVEEGAEIGRGGRIFAGAQVGASSLLGEDCVVGPRAIVAHRCRLGDRVRLQMGAIVGSDGFGYAPVNGEFQKIPQIGIVVLEDDVEIGANACIDRATMGVTTIGRGTKIDNLVQIAHNVAIGHHCVLAAQAGVAGSTTLGDRVRLGGQAGLVGHIQIGDGVSVGAQAGVIGDIASGLTVSGYPARPHRDALRVEAAVRRLPDLVQRLKALEREAGEGKRR